MVDGEPGKRAAAVTSLIFAGSGDTVVGDNARESHCREGEESDRINEDDLTGRITTAYWQSWYFYARMELSASVIMP